MLHFSRPLKRLSPVLFLGVLSLLAVSCSHAGDRGSLAPLPLEIPEVKAAGFSVIETEKRDGYSVSRVEYGVASEEKIPAFLLIPDGASEKDKVPGLLLLHDHGARFDIGKEKLVRPLEDYPEHIRLSSLRFVEDNFDGVYFGERLCREGYAVLVPDVLYWGERSTPLCQKWSRVNFLGEEGDLKELKDIVYEGQRAVYDSLYSKGIVWAEQTLWEDAASLELLRSLPEVKDDKVGAFGWSMGAHRCWLLGAVSKNLASGVALCWMTLKSTCDNPPKASDYSMMIPRLRDEYDFPDIARNLAPERFLFLSGKEDKLFPVDSVAKAFGIMQDIYSRKGAEGRLETELFDGYHHCGLKEQERIISFFKETLSE